MSENNTDDPTSNYRGYAVNYNKGVVHVDPVTNKLHRDDHICNQQCRDLAARAKEEHRQDILRETTRESDWGKLSDSGRVTVSPEGKVKISDRKPKKTTDDVIVDITGEASIQRFLEEHKTIIASGGWEGPTADVLAEWEKNRQDLEGTYSEDDDEDIPTPASDVQERLTTALADELMKHSVHITPASCMYFAGYLAERVVKEGWVRNEYPDNYVGISYQRGGSWWLHRGHYEEGPFMHQADAEQRRADIK